MCTTAEEKPACRREVLRPASTLSRSTTLADINIDSLNEWGKARDIEDVSFAFSTLDDMLADAAKRRGEPRFRSGPEKGAIN